MFVTGSLFLLLSFFLGLLLSFATGMQSLRQTCIMVLPLLAFEGQRGLSMMLGKVRRTWTPTLRALGCAAANLAGLLLIRALQVPSTTIYGSVELLSPELIPQHLRSAAEAISQITGFAYLSWRPTRFLSVFCIGTVSTVILALVHCLHGWLRRREEP